MICNKCKTESMDGDIFCRSCGEKTKKPLNIKRLVAIISGLLVVAVIVFHSIQIYKYLPEYTLKSYYRAMEKNDYNKAYDLLSKSIKQEIKRSDYVEHYKNDETNQVIEISISSVTYRGNILEIRHKFKSYEVGVATSVYIDELSSFITKEGLGWKLLKVQYYLDKAQELRIEKKYEEALAFLKRAEDHNPYIGDPHFFNSLTYSSKYINDNHSNISYLDSGLVEIEKAIALDPNNANYRRWSIRLNYSKYIQEKDPREQSMLSERIKSDRENLQRIEPSPSPETLEFIQDMKKLGLTWSINRG